MENERTVKTICRMCMTCCGLDVTTRDGKVVKVASMEEHLFKPLCPKSAAMIEWEYSPERLRSPMMKVNGTLKETSWDEALDFVASKLKDLRERYGARSLALHFGNPFVSTHVEKVARRFCDAYGTPNFTSGSSFCFYAKVLGHSLTLEYGRINAAPNYRGTKCAVIWGNNPEESAHLMFARLQAYRKEPGSKIIVIDPRKTTLAKQADIHAQVRPGTDCALALGLLNVVMEEKLYDADFVEKWTFGFDKLVQHVKSYPPEEVQEITGVPAGMIREIARIYATSKPANIAQGIAVDHQVNGVQCSRALAILMAITGNVDIPGGNTWPGRIAYTNLRIPGRVDDKEGISAQQYPIFNQFTLEQTAVCLPDAIIDEKPYPIKAMLVQGSNPVLIWPNTKNAIKALKKLELLVVVDLFMSETAKLADVVLPCPTFLERKSFKDYRNMALPLLAVGEKAVEPTTSSMEDWKILAELGKRLGYQEYFPWENTEQLLSYLLEPTGVTLEQLKAKPGGIIPISSEKQRYLKAGKFNTPSGKVELYSETLASHGYDPLPTYHEPAESPVGSPDLAKKYPLTCIIGPRTRFFTHSQHRNIPSLRSKVGEPAVIINARTAKALGIADGDAVTIESLRGSIRVKARLTEDIGEKVVALQHGWAEANANLLTDDRARDPISGYPAFRTGLCRIKKA